MLQDSTVQMIKSSVVVFLFLFPAISFANVDDLSRLCTLYLPHSEEVKRATAQNKLSYQECIEAIEQFESFQGSETLTPQEYETALALTKKQRDSLANIFASMPDSKVFLREKSILRSKEGNSFISSGNYTDALKAFQEAIKMMRLILVVDNTDTRAMKDSAILYYRISKAYLLLGKTEPALSAKKMTLEYFTNILDMSPRNLQARNDVALAYEELGDLYYQLNNADLALEYYNKGLELHRDIVKEKPADPKFQRLLARSLENLGDIYYSFSQLDRALEFQQETLKIQRNLVRKKLKNNTDHNNLYSSLIKIGRTYQKKIEHNNKRIKTDSNNEQIKAELAFLLNELSMIEREKEKYTAEFMNKLNAGSK